MLFLLDAGHGGIINGIYQTEGKRSPTWDDGLTLYEGEFNRAVVARIKEMLNMAGIAYADVVITDRDISLRERTLRANYYHSKFGDCVYVSIHANAGGGNGFEIFTYPGDSDSDKYATLFAEAFQEEFPERKVRSDFSDGDVDKEAKFYVLKHTTMPAVLTENFFMDNEEECRTFLMDQYGRDRIAHFHVQAMKRIIALNNAS